MFDGLLRMHLGPIIERLAQMETELEDLHRRAESFCRIGVCQEVDACNGIDDGRRNDVLALVHPGWRIAGLLLESPQQSQPGQQHKNQHREIKYVQNSGAGIIPP